MPDLHQTKAVLARVGVPGTALLGHPMAAVLAVLLLAVMTVASMLWRLYGAALVGDLTRAIVVRLRVKFHLPSIEDSPTGHELSEKDR